MLLLNYLRIACWKLGNGHWSLDNGDRFSVRLWWWLIINQSNHQSLC